MDKIITITTNEVRDIAKTVQKFQSLKTVKSILDIHPERASEFGFHLDEFSNLENELKDANQECQHWWFAIADKYNLPKESAFRVSYNDNSLTVVG